MLSVSQLVSSNIESDDRNDQNYLNDLIDPKDLDDWMTESFADD